MVSWTQTLKIRARIETIDAAFQRIKNDMADFVYWSLMIAQNYTSRPVYHHFPHKHICNISSPTTILLRILLILQTSYNGAWLAAHVIIDNAIMNINAKN